MNVTYWILRGLGTDANRDIPEGHGRGDEGHAG